MKTFRLFVLVLLAMLLPLRGVSAATSLCEQQPGSHGAVVVHDHGHDMFNAAGHDDAQHGQDQGHDHDSVDKGRHCVSSCSSPPLMGESLSVAQPAATGTTVFPRFAAPAAKFQSERQERPPRSI